jgi:hypothetical protein
MQLRSRRSAKRSKSSTKRSKSSTAGKLKNYEQSTKQVDLAKRQLEHEIDRIQKEEEFYFSHGCAKNNTDAFLCPPNTPRFAYKPEPKSIG